MSQIFYYRIVFQIKFGFTKILFNLIDFDEILILLYLEFLQQVNMKDRWRFISFK